MDKVDTIVLFEDEGFKIEALGSPKDVSNQSYVITSYEKDSTTYTCNNRSDAIALSSALIVEYWKRTNYVKKIFDNL